ncbi:MAG: hypothetical protein IPP35_05590 [Elusimicrobia bacterium]|nr:hypothetical protein [Elusimicrobiota bacterium]
METETPVLDSFSLSNFLRGGVDIFRSPKGMFRAMSKDGGFGKPILYAFLWQYVAAALALILSFLRPIPAPFGVWGNVFIFFLIPPMMVAVGFVVSAILFLIWHLLGSSLKYQTAFRVWALLCPLAVVSAVLGGGPVLSALVMGFYFFLLAMASIHVHGVPAARAWTVWGLLFSLLVLLMVVSRVIEAQRGRLQSGRGRFSAPGAPAMLPPPAVPGTSGQPMTRAELQKKMEEEMAKAKADSERRKKESESPILAPKKAPVRR